MTDVFMRESWIFDMRTDLLHYSMRFTSLLLYLLIMLTRQIKCHSECSKESVEIVKRITRELSQVKNDSMLYTPTLADYEQNCSKSTLKCFELEVNVLFVEIQSAAKSQSRRLLRILKTLTHQSQLLMAPPTTADGLSYHFLHARAAVATTVSCKQCGCFTVGCKCT
uniref:Interleukin 15, like n=1 Tax=Cyprinus carpio carpio TaxID=630221 RepID=A0A8C1HGA7_CYPCA